MIKKLIKISNSLDSKGFSKESDYLDGLIRKISADYLDEILDGPNPAPNSLEDASFNPLDTATEPALELDFGTDSDDNGELSGDLEFGSEDMAKGLPNYQEYEAILSGLREQLPDMDPAQLEEILLMVANNVSTD